MCWSCFSICIYLTSQFVFVAYSQIAFILPLTICVLRLLNGFILLLNVCIWCVFSIYVYFASQHVFILLLDICFVVSPQHTMYIHLGSPQNTCFFSIWLSRVCYFNICILVLLCMFFVFAMRNFLSFSNCLYCVFSTWLFGCFRFI